VLIQQALSALVVDITVIIIAHRLQSVMNADQIIVLEHGGIKVIGRHEELLEKNGLYSGLWREQSKAGNWRMPATNFQ